jgi:acrylyl-CoA reductase (NADPH)/3-hydroxypropionyl-CoA dehydratase/3-hydroxypropionyl-CoA synthetase
MITGVHMVEQVYQPPIPDHVIVNPITNQADWNNMRQACDRDPGAFHGDLGAREIHWFDPSRNAWLTRNENGTWSGWDATSGRPVEDDHWVPWHKVLEDKDAPFYRWFVGAHTNAAFNEVDRHVLSGHGDEIAFWYEGDSWDAEARQGKGAPLKHESLTRKELFVQSVLAAQALTDLGLEQGDRIALNMPNILDQIIWTEAAKRLGVIYTPVFGGFSDKTLSDRIEDAGARVVITADGASRNARTVAFKEAYTDPALERFVSVRNAVEILRETEIAESLRETIVNHCREVLADEITLTPADISREVRRVLESADVEVELVEDICSKVLEALGRIQARVDKVIVVRHAGIIDVPWCDSRDVWSHDLIEAASRKVCDAANVTDIHALMALNDADLAEVLWRSVPARPLEADYPLFIIYTSGSTGKPKGVVHVHGGYVAGVTHTMKVSFDAQSGVDRIYVVADPGWITGQSYLITASLAGRITGVVTEGTPLFPDAGRFASIIERHGITIFKAGVTFLKTVMADPQNRVDVERYDLSSLKVATFCAEPTSPAVQRFGMELMTPQYINSYWATEHGGIVWTHAYGNVDQPLRADAHTYPLPWVFGDVWVAEGEPDDQGRCAYRAAREGEKGEIVITRPYPYLARTIWGDGDNLGAENWRGDINRFTATYFGRFRDASGSPLYAYLQGDFAMRYANGSFSLHGRSDDVINVSGHRIGTEEIEGAILKDKLVNPDSPVGNCIVVGAPHPQKGLVPVAFIVTAQGASLTRDDESRLLDLVRKEKGPVAVPGDFIVLSAFPETRSGKYMRRFLRSMMEGEPLGDVTTLRNPECLAEIESAIRNWKQERNLVEED